VAGVTNSKNIKEAFEKLRPAAVTVAMKKARVKTKNQMKRRNKGFVRQGEWFFVPVDFQINETTVIHKNEPISRPGGSPHIIEELVRFGGNTIYIKGDTILTENDYKRLKKENRVNSLGFTQRVRGARVFARGKVKHRDHSTIELRGWHEVHLSNERGSSINAFID
jgi:hypothetical protein